MKEKALEKLVEWMKPLAIPAGRYKSREYDYILPLQPYGKGKRRNAIAKSLTKYNVLTDGVKYFPNVLPVNELHTYANHLNSSQILCYNFFGKLLSINEYSERKIRINPEMRNWLDRYLPAIPKLIRRCYMWVWGSSKSKGGHFIWFLLLMTVTQKYVLKSSLRKMDLVRQKKTSKSKSGISHHQKYTDLYQPLLNKSTVVRNPDTVNDFFCNYQLFRNVIIGNRPGTNRGNIYII